MEVKAMKPLIVFVSITCVIGSPAADAWKREGGAVKTTDGAFSLPAAGSAVVQENIRLHRRGACMLQFEAAADAPATVRAGTSDSWHEFSVEAARRPCRFFCFPPADRAGVRVEIRVTGGRNVRIASPRWKEVKREICRFDDYALGLGTALHGNRYYHTVLFGEPEGQVLSDLWAATCSFPGACAAFRPGEYLEFSHGPRVPDQAQQRASLIIEVRDCAGGGGVVEVSRDGRTYLKVGDIKQDGTSVLEIPAEVFPRRLLGVRVSSPETGGGTFRLTRYAYTADYGNDVGHHLGNVYFVATEEPVEGFTFLPDSVRLSGLRPGRYERFEAQVRSQESFRGQAEFTVRRLWPGEPADGGTSAARFFLRPGETRKRTFGFVYDGGGRYELTARLLEEDSVKAQARVFFLAPFPSTGGTGTYVGRAQGLNWWICDLATTPGRTELPPFRNVSAEPVALSLASGEREAFLLVVSAYRDANEIALGAIGGSDGVHVAINQLEAVFAGTPSPGRAALGYWFDPLRPAGGPLNLAGEQSHVFLVEVAADHGCAAGKRSFALEIRKDTDVVGTIPVTTELFGFDLKKAPRLPLVGPVDLQQLLRVWGPAGKESEAIWKAFVELARSYGITPENPLEPAGGLWEQKGLVVSLAREKLVRALDAGGGYVVERAPFRLSLTAGMEASLLGEEGESVPSRDNVQAALRDLAGVLKERDLLELAYVAPGGRAGAAKAQLGLARALLTTGLRVMLPGLPREELKEKGVTWCAPLSAIVATRPSLPAGQELWTTLEHRREWPSQLIDGPRDALRGLGVLAWGRGVKGVRLPGLANWGLPGSRGPLLSPAGYSSELPGEEQVYGNGAGFLFWPPASQAAPLAHGGTIAAPAGSVRAEVLRQAAEDWQYLSVLSSAVTKAEKAGVKAGELTEAKACLAWARGLKAAPSAPELARQRRAIGNQIARLRGGSAPPGAAKHSKE